MASFTPLAKKFTVGLAIFIIPALVLSLGPTAYKHAYRLSPLPTARAAEGLPYTETPFILVGTITSEKGQKQALIQAPNVPLKFYSIGEKLNGYTLLEVTREHVKLSLGKQRYILYLQQKTLTSIENTSLVASSQTNIVIKRELLNHIRNNRQAWLNAVSLSLQMSDGYVSGYLVESVKKIPFGSNIGLKEGDIIKSINGVSIGQSLLFAKTVNNLMKVSDIAIQVERGHKLYLLNYNIKD